MWLIVVYGSVVFFFFKQKTAYEVRISDWSSDVCSSDLGPGAGLPQAAGQLRGADDPCRAGGGADAADLGPRRAGDGAARGTFADRAARPLGGRVPDPEDRKSVVDGKSVSVRVDHGARRLIKNKSKPLLLDEQHNL